VSPIAANHYVLTGLIAGTVDTAGAGGKPEVSVRFAGRPIEDPQLEPTPFGLQVIGLIDARPELDTRHLLLLLPDVNVTDAPVPVASVAAVVTTRTSVGGPSLVEGPVQSYAIHPVAASASAVES
jgi:hypothetical protein